MKSIYFPQHGGVSTEQNLIQSLIDEQIKLFGTDVYYLPRSSVKDMTLDDIKYSEFKTQWMIEMFLINVEKIFSDAEKEIAMILAEGKDQYELPDMDMIV